MDGEKEYLHGERMFPVSQVELEEPYCSNRLSFHRLTGLRAKSRVNPQANLQQILHRFDEQKREGKWSPKRLVIPRSHPLDANFRSLLAPRSSCWTFDQIGENIATVGQTVCVSRLQDTNRGGREGSNYDKILD